MAWWVDPASDRRLYRVSAAIVPCHILREGPDIKWDFAHPLLKAIVAKGDNSFCHVLGMLHCNIVQRLAPSERWPSALTCPKPVGEIERPDALLLHLGATGPLSRIPCIRIGIDLPLKVFHSDDLGTPGSRLPLLFLHIPIIRELLQITIHIALLLN